MQEWYDSSFPQRAGYFQRRRFEILLLAGIIFPTVGILMIVRPALIWEITQSWKTNDGTEPSDLYIFSTRFGGVVVTLVGIFCIIVFILLLTSAS